MSNFNVYNPEGFFNYPNVTSTDNQPCDETIGNCGVSINIINTPSINLAGSGNTCIPLSANVNISSASGNSISINEDGLFSSGGGVLSFNGRTGLVIPQNGDYSYSGLLNIPNVFSSGISNSQTLSLTGVTHLSSYGDSFTNGYHAQDPTLIYPLQLGSFYGLTVNNQGINSAGNYTTTKDIISANYVSSTRNDLVTLLTGSLDIIGNNSTALNRNKIKGLLRVSLANLFLKSVVSFSDASVTKSGFSNTTVACQSKSTVLSQSVVKSSASGSTASFTFTGTDLVIGTFATSIGNIVGGWNIVIDGSSGFGSTYWRDYNGSETFANTGNYALANEAGLAIYPDCIIIRGLTSGTHNVVITSDSATNTYLDYYGILDVPTNVKPVVVSSIPFPDTNLYLNYSIVDNRDFNSDATLISRVMREACTEFYDYPLSFIDINKFWFAPTMVQRPDNLHPKTTGQTAFFNAFKSGVSNQRIEYITDYDAYYLSSFKNDVGYITSSGVPVTSVFGRTGAISLLSADVTGALGFTPYNATNPSGYINTISGIAAGGDLSGTYPNPTVLNSAVIGKVLTGYISGAGVVAATDSILQAIEKLNGNTAALITGVSGVSNSDSSLTISPTTGAVVASLNLAHSNTFTVPQGININATGLVTAFDVAYNIPAPSTNVLIARFVGQNNLVTGNRNAFIKFGVGGADAAYWDWVNDGGGGMYWAYGNDPVNLNTAGTTYMLYDGRVSMKGPIGMGAFGFFAPASAVLALSSTTQGFLPPVMTTTQKNAISSPAEGLTVYDLTLHKMYTWDGSTWQAHS